MMFIKIKKIKKEYKVILVALLVLKLFGCAPKLMIVTEPSEVNLTLRLPNGNLKPLGKSPLEIDLNELEKEKPSSPATGEMSNIQLEKEGFETQEIWVPGGRFGLNRLSVFSKMNPGTKVTRSADLLLQSLHNVQKFAASGNYEIAIREVDKVITENPTFIRAISMKGAILFSQQKYDESLSFYEKALSLDKQFDEAIRMIEMIKSKKGELPK